ncbi:hypothetical protein HBI46_181260 [Parastagonospora nodorum]|nr:hypothetical protein HBH42_176400 [Parastagonospora nodorum]KAH4842079.1 hypothetical protein HBH75_218850 [Parastagonospora nodorum]KAH5046496.1 hypothetical protein HBH96_229350 [Parastagonospora nodorum]KAH5407884.1 hypothetical protein HBI46_181260 [Parastagonospora nodorum]KAH5455775.1 hypothetical protein HBI31_236760 [Parastagonospora nodorum]
METFSPTPTDTTTMKLHTRCDSMSAITSPASDHQAMVVGIYGIPGSGKTFLINQLRQRLEKEPFMFWDGSQVIASVVPGGLGAFHELEEEEKKHWRELAINKIKQSCLEDRKLAVVAGHLMLWHEGESAGQLVCTQSDLKNYTHIIYLDTPPNVVLQRRSGDTARDRPSTTVSQLNEWQVEEKSQLLRLCRENNILLSHVYHEKDLLSTVSSLLRNFQQHTEKQNMHAAEMALEKAVAAEVGQPDTLLVLDADKTLATADTGMMFWEQLRLSQQSSDLSCPLRALFSSPLGYSYNAFRQAVLLYEEAADDLEYDAICQDVASAVIMHPEFVSLLQVVSRQDHVRAVVVSCGLRRVWEIVLKRAGLSDSVKVIAGGRISDGYVVTGPVKAALVARSQELHNMFVWAFGDSVLDLGMLRNADRAIIVTGDEQTRSKTMDAALKDVIDHGAFRAHQVLLPSHVQPRLSTLKLPLIQLTDRGFVDELLGVRKRRATTQLVHAGDRNAAKLLMTSMRDAAVSGPELRKFHGRVGWYLATDLLAQLIGIQEYPIQHVQGHTTSGFRLLHEGQTLIVALMRGGEPMAFGVNEAFPRAMFLHARCPGDVLQDHVKGKVTVILVDSVVNSGKTVVDFVQHIRDIHATVHLVVVAGVIQAECMTGGLQSLAQDPQLDLVALRLSENKFTGRGTTDTGNRLFNTTHLA